MKISFYRIISAAAHAVIGASLFLLVLFSLAVSSCDLTIEPIKIENTGNGGDDDTDDDQEPVEVPVQKVLITFSGDTFTVPLVYGPDFSDGKIFWGDDSEEESYEEGASHTYPSAGEYVVTLEVPDAETIELKDLVGVSDIDLSGF